jgi:hypothetical protein
MTQRWNDRATHRIQTDNSIEAMLRKSGVASWLETCGPTAATIACEVTGHDVTVRLPGGATIQGEDALTAWMNDPANVAALKAARPGIDPLSYMDNEIIQYYPVALKTCFGADAMVKFGQTFDDVAAAVREGAAVMIHLVKPAHYLCVVAVDEAGPSLIYRDPWPARTGTDGWNLKLGREAYPATIQDSVVVVRP